MTHPSLEEWMSFLYGELDATIHAEFDKHLSNCPECHSAVASWRGLMSELNTFKLPHRQPQRTQFPFATSFVKWGIAAMIILGIGFASGRVSQSAKQDLQRLHAAVIPAVREQLREEFKADLRAALAPAETGTTNEFRRAMRAAFSDWAAKQNETAAAQTQDLLAALTATIASGRAEDRQTTLALLKNLEQQNFAAYAHLKKNLETVAVVADNRFQHAETQLGQLISYTQPNPE